MTEKEEDSPSSSSIPFNECGTVRIVEIGSFEKTPPDTDFGDRLNRKSLVGHGLETLRKIVTTLADSTAAAVSGSSNTISRPKYKSSALTYLLRNELAGEPNPVERTPEEEKAFKKQQAKGRRKSSVSLPGASKDEEIVLPVNDHHTIFIGCIGGTSQHFNSQVTTLKFLDKARNFNSSYIDLKAILDKRVQKGHNSPSKRSSASPTNERARSPSPSLSPSPSPSPAPAPAPAPDQGQSQIQNHNLISRLSSEIEQLEDLEFNRVGEEEVLLAEEEKKAQRSKKNNKNDPEAEENDDEPKEILDKFGQKKLSKKEKERIQRRENAKAAHAKKLKEQQMEEGVYPTGERAKRASFDNGYTHY